MFKNFIPIVAANSVQTGLPDITQPAYLNSLASQLPATLVLLTLLVIGLGIGIALINFSLRPHQAESTLVVGDWAMGYSQLLRFLQHAALVLSAIGLGFLLCGTLAHRYQNWEKSQAVQATPVIVGEQIQQTSPLVSYTTKEPFEYTTQLNGKLVKVRDNKDVDRSMNVTGSNLQVNINPTRDPAVYGIDFRGDYQVTNPVGTTDRFIFQITPPTGYSLLENFAVEENGKRLAPTNQGEYKFPLRIAPGNVAKLRVLYTAKGSPQWVYSAKDGVLGNFRMNLAAKVPNIDIAGGIAPSRTETKGQQKIFTWSFKDNATLQRPFGVAVSPTPIVSTGTMPLVLILAPGLLLWWLLLLYFSIPLSLKNAAIASGVFFASMLALSYLARLGNPLYAWAAIAVIMLLTIWGIGRDNWRISLAAIICTIAAIVLPIFGILGGFSGLALSLAGLMSVLWLAARNWYGLYEIVPRPTIPVSEDDFVRHDVLEEAANYNQISSGELTGGDIAEHLREKGVKSVDSKS
jgi:hypothetical protein